ncbi:MAG TPA: DNA-3-methyladenine glycosylase I [Candidatus Dormibacteraeota bacterium]|nr:DNA-3-methyladenine glycosylase I [Candidatus Dormibacteraeota bacterium]
MAASSGVTTGADGIKRCWWGDADELYRRYHDQEWGRPSADDRRLFEKLCLEGFMSGLSWLTILRKREHFRAAFLDFEPVVIARFGARDVRRLMADEGIVRNRAKIDAVINNAGRMPELVEEFGSFAAYVWRYEPRKRTGLEMPPESVALSKDLRRRSWGFVGPTTVLSFMQAMGLVNDHVRGCAARAECERLRREFARPG